jgi:hypothetical protein
MSVIETVQSGGNHYKGMGIQPIKFAYANGYDAAAFSTLKYVSRHRRKEGDLDLKKAIDFVDFRVELIETDGECLASDEIKIEDYISSNKIGSPEDDILRVLHLWATGRLQDPHEGVLVIKGLINDLRVELYQKGTR